MLYIALLYIRNHQFSDIEKLIDCDIKYLNSLLTHGQVQLQEIDNIWNLFSIF